MKPGNRAVLSLKVAQQTWERIFRAEDVDKKRSSCSTKLGSHSGNGGARQNHQSPQFRQTVDASHIKMEIKPRQRAFSRGDSINYTRLCNKISSLISKAKIVYYESKAKDHRKLNSSKWFESISSLVGMEGTSNLSANGCQNYDLSELTEKLQDAFTAPWNGMMLDNAASYDLNNVQHHIKETDPPYHQ
jgi:hypothetical protein